MATLPVGIGVGWLGGFTAFSTFSVQIVRTPTLARPAPQGSTSVLR